MDENIKFEQRHPAEIWLQEAKLSGSIIHATKDSEQFFKILEEAALNGKKVDTILLAAVER